ncbi:MAG TPA: Rossmann-like and DUF2520 domain-containing protein [Pyrinomonadaceae bacterium]|nr:Rossmann-like and DUF2520 domain-containing protein [Pyrinomonadaceae bacterium]
MSDSRRRKSKSLSVSVVGSGRLGTALARALASATYEVEAVVARRIARARRAAELLGPGTLALSEEQLDRLPASKIVFITTPDAEILKIATRIAGLEGSSKGRTVLHTSGALSASEVLAPLAAAGFSTGSIHPLVSISESRVGAEKLRGAYYCLEGDVIARRVARSIVKDLEGHSFYISSKYKPLYHAAAVMASGHVTALVAIAIEMLTQCGIDERTARRVLRPLLESTMANLIASGPEDALTGTFARGDLVTVRRHLQALSNKTPPAALAAYKLLGRQSLALTQQKIDPKTRKQILEALK